jgi:hypothetical protein
MVDAIEFLQSGISFEFYTKDITSYSGLVRRSLIDSRMSRRVLQDAHSNSLHCQDVTRILPHLSPHGLT